VHLVDFSIIGAAVALIVGTMASIIGGALGGIFVGGRALGNELAALMGGFYGPLAGVPGIVVALVVLAVLS
jgi:ABC-type phosphate transport system permease subunit